MVGPAEGTAMDYMSVSRPLSVVSHLVGNVLVCDWVADIFYGVFSEISR